MTDETDTPMPEADVQDAPTREDTAPAMEANEANPDDADADHDDEGDDAEAEGRSETDTGDDAEGDDEAKEDADADLIEVEYGDGKKAKLPREIAEGVMRHRDYTQKTQAVAEERRAVAEMKSALTEFAQSSQEEIATFSQLQGVRTQYQQVNQALDQYANVDWNAWRAQDYDAYERGADEFRQLQAQERAIRIQAESLNQQYAQTSAKKQQSLAKERETRIKAVSDFAKTNIPSWNPELDSKIGQFAKETLQVDDAWMRQNLTPQVYKAAWLAMIGAQQVEKAKAKPVEKKTAQLQPTARIKGKAGPDARKTLIAMSMEEYAAEMNRREKARKAAK
jgi:hypothetical protein